LRIGGSGSRLGDNSGFRAGVKHPDGRKDFERHDSLLFNLLVGDACHAYHALSEIQTRRYRVVQSSTLRSSGRDGSRLNRSGLPGHLLLRNPNFDLLAVRDRAADRADAVPKKLRTKQAYGFRFADASRQQQVRRREN